MSSFENTLERMKNLYTYGKELNESSKSNAYTLEHSSVAADGKTYGIIRECNKYYIKAAQKGRETIAESYEYIGGICNKKHYEYASYNNALKNFELKMASINEACDGNVNISTLDPFKKGDFIVEGTDKMKNEIARQRQIMYNVAMLMNEGTEIGASRKDDVVMNRDANPEAETGKKGDEGMTNATAKPDYAGSKTNGVNKKVAPFAENAPKCEDQLKEACDCGSENCDCDWGAEGIGKGRDPKSVGWDIDGQHVVNEEEDDWASKGLPSTPGVGEADTDHNNEPFTDTVNENEEIDVVDDVEGDDVDFGVDTEDEVDDFDTEDEFDSEDELDTEDDLDMDDELDAEDDLDMDDEFASDEELDVEDDTVGDEQDILAQIEDLQAQIDALRAEIGGEEEFDSEKLGDEFDDEELDAELDAEDDFESDELDAENDFESDEDFENDFESDEDFEDEDEEAIMEAKKQRMNNIVESVVKSILSEDELHDFGKHPGYRKKPMDLPSTGEDKNQWGEDWNDESVHSEEPFGTKIGSSAPFEKVVDAISKHVMSKISEAVKGGKKKVK